MKATYLRKHFWNILGIILSAMLLTFGNVFCIWQLDLICTGPVWFPGWSHPVGTYADDYFQCFFWKTTIGMAYDTLLFCIALSSFVGYLLLFVSLWTWND